MNQVYPAVKKLKLIKEHRDAKKRKKKKLADEKKRQKKRMIRCDECKRVLHTIGEIRRCKQKKCAYKILLRKQGYTQSDSQQLIAGTVLHTLLNIKHEK